MSKHDDEAGDGPRLTPEQARELILKRRAKFMAAALAGVGVGGCTKASTPTVCLSLQAPEDAGLDASRDSGGPQVCLSPPAPCADPNDPECQPMVCLEPPLTCDIDPTLPECEDAAVAADAGDDDAGIEEDSGAAKDASIELDSGPQVCLSLPAPDAGETS